MSLFVIECKHYKDVNLWSIITKTEGDTVFGWWKSHVDKAKSINKKPVLIVRQNHRPILWVCTDHTSQYISSKLAIKPIIKTDYGMCVYCLDEIFSTDSAAFNMMLESMSVGEENYEIN